jgi:hypothetical protein
MMRLAYILATFAALLALVGADQKWPLPYIG